MSSPLIGALPEGTGSVDGAKADYESELPDNNPALDEGESNDDEATVDEDVREADAVNDNLEQ